MAIPRPSGGIGALLIALGFALALGWSQSAPGPSRAELAAALNRAGGPTITATDIRSLDCAAPDSLGYACHWRQRDAALWHPRNATLIIDGNGWLLAAGRDGAAAASPVAR